MLNSIRRKFAEWIAPPARRSLDDMAGLMQHGFATPSLGTLAGPSITSQSALTIAAVWSACSQIVNAVSTMPLHVGEKDDRGGRKPARRHAAYELLNLRPNRRSTSMRLRQAWVGHAVTRGNGYLEIEWDAAGRDPVALHLLDPRDIEPYEDDADRVWYRQKSGGPDLPSHSVVHLAMWGFDGVQGYSPIEYHAEGLGVAKAQQLYQASLFGNGAQTTGHLEFPQNLTPIQKQQERDSWNRMHQGPTNGGVLGILANGAKFVQTQFSPQDAELILGCHFSVEDVARVWNISPGKLGLPGAPVRSEEDETADFLKWTVQPWLTAIEQEFDLKLLSRLDRVNYFVFHDVSSLQRGNIATETAREQADVASGIRSINEVRVARGLERIDDPNADLHLIPTNNLTPLEALGEDGRPPTTQPLMSRPGGQGQPDVPSSAEGEADATTIQDTALNGAQIASFLEVISAVTAGTLPAESAKGILQSSFPTVSPEKIEAILAPLANFEPAATPQGGDGGPDVSRAVVRQAVERMMRVEANAIRRAAGKDRFDLWADGFYPKHEAKLADAIAAPLGLMGLDRGVAEMLAGEWSTGSRAALRGLYTTTPPDEMPAAVEKLVDSWAGSRVGPFVEGIGGKS